MKLLANRTLFDAPQYDYFGNPLKTMLFDVVADPAQNTELDDEAIERRLKQEIKRLMEDNDAPQEQFARMGLDSL